MISIEDKKICALEYELNESDDEDRGKSGKGFMSAYALEEVDIGDGDRPRPIFISKKLDKDVQEKLIKILREYRDCFAWEYHEMPGLSRSIVEHYLPIKLGYHPYKQPNRRMESQVREAIKEEIAKLYEAKFIRPCRYGKWVSNIVPVEMKQKGKWRVCIDFRDLKKAKPKDEYPMHVVDLLVDAAVGHKIITFMDGNPGYNKISMAEEDISRTTFKWFGAIGLFEWVVMTFTLKNAGNTYQRAMNYIFHDLIDRLVEIYIDDVVVKSREVEDHLANLREVLERTRKYGVKMNPNKCASGISACEFLGFLVLEEGI